MKKIIVLVVGLALMVVLPVSAQEDEGIIATVANGCKVDLESYCKDVTPGEGRVLACLFAHSDKLSSKCEYALYDSAVQLERAVAALTYMANECGEDMVALCGDVEVGEGRVIDCLAKNESKVSDRCKEAQKTLGFVE